MNILAMVILGGMGNLLGVVLGAALLVAFPEIFRDLQAYRMLVFGLLLMVLMIFRPQGLLAVQGRREEEPVDGGLAEEEQEAEASV
jgi:branched-chain amino acid transport system permease protein